jgi:4-carboxymuconolactone decarboxylase
MLAGFAGKLNVYRLMAHHPALLSAWADLRNHIVLENTLVPREQEIVILRTGHRLKSAYEWTHHVQRGKAAGLTAEEIEAARREPSCWRTGARETVLMRAVDELIDEARLSPATVRDLRAIIGTEGVLDLMATVGMYTTLGFVTNTFEPPIEASLPDSSIMRQDGS